MSTIPVPSILFELRQLAVGLAQYDPLQEGLGVLAEYLTGYLPGSAEWYRDARAQAAGDG